MSGIVENGFEGDFLVYLIAGPRDKNVDDKCIVSIIGNWLYIRTTKDVVDRLDLHGLLAVQKVADHFNDYITRQNAKATFDASFPGPVVRLLFDSLNQDKRERLFSMKDQNHGKVCYYCFLIMEDFFALCFIVRYNFSSESDTSSCNRCDLLLSLSLICIIFIY